MSAVAHEADMPPISGAVCGRQSRGTAACGDSGGGCRRIQPPDGCGRRRRIGSAPAVLLIFESAAQPLQLGPTISYNELNFWVGLASITEDPEFRMGLY